ncbi:hypothetical protein C1X79_19995 [Pseudomonas sp. FW305-42]|nr:hypothetical protein C1X79_19995 [Pseudomonas sp. FW305-42]
MGSETVDLDYLGVEALVAELAEQDEVLAEVVRSFLLSNPSDRLRNSFRKAFNRLRAKVKASDFLCCFQGCTNAAIRSHEIAESRQIRFLAERENDRVFVDVLTDDLRGNPYEMCFKETPVKSATTFIGYCKEHDGKLFFELDKMSDPDNFHLMNLQFMRTLGREKTECDQKIRAMKIMVDELEAIALENPGDGFEEARLIMMGHLDDQQAARERVAYVHDKVAVDVQEGKQPIVVKKFSVNEPGYMFSTCMDTTRPGEDYFFTFLAKKNFDGESFFYVGALDNRFKQEIFEYCDISTQQGRWDVSDLMLALKDRLIFSPGFKGMLDEGMKKIFCRSRLELGGIDKFLVELHLFPSSSV